MFDILENPLLKLYLTLIGWVLLGFILGRHLPKTVSKSLGRSLYWVGVPISIIAFLRRTQLSGYILIAPLTAWIAILVGAGFAWLWIELGVSDERLKALTLGIENFGDLHPETSENSPLPKTAWSKPTQGSFLLAMMVGNTAYLGFPVVLSLTGPDYFSWAVLYNTLGSTLAIHGLGFVVATRFGRVRKRQKTLRQVLLQNPALWSFLVGIIVRNIPLPIIAEQTLKLSAWTVVTLFLVMMGMQLSQLSSIHKIWQASTCLIIKMLLVPLVVGTGLMFFGVTGDSRLVLVLQMAMPPSFATVLYAQGYDLDSDLSVTAVALGAVVLLFTLPVWIFLFR